MSTKDSIYYAQSDSGIACHIYWELAERVLKEGRMMAAPIFRTLGHVKNAEPCPIRLTPEIGRQVCESLGKRPSVEII